MDDDLETEWWREVRYGRVRYGDSKNEPESSIKLVPREILEDNDRLPLDESVSMIMAFPEGSSKELVLKSRVGSGEVESEFGLVPVVLSLDKPDSVVIASSNPGNSKDQASATSSSGESSNGVGTFPTCLERASFWSGTRGGMSSRS
jgi:hypothetical protein